MEDFKRNHNLKHESLAQPSYSFALLHLITLAIVYTKIEDDLYVTWMLAFTPSFLYYFIQIIKYTVAIASE